MKKRNKIITILLSTLLFSFLLIGCGSEPVQVNISNSENISSNQFGQFITIGDNLVYDSATRIVYMVYGVDGVYESKTYCPYYAQNGLPYRYNPETNTFEEIDEDKE